MGSAPVRGCLDLCEQSTDSPKPATDLPQFLPVVLSVVPALAGLAIADSVVPADSAGLKPGTALYLRFHRYLN